MLLQTPSYLLFLLAVAIIYWVMPKGNWRKKFLLVASYLFYALFDIRFAVLLFSLSVVIYWLGIGIARGAHSRLFAWLSVAVNLGILGFFKYANFFLTSVQSGMQFFGLNDISPGLKLILPIGISFYTFQAISYTTEIYRKKLQPAKNFCDFALYLSFFPKLIAGPLVRPAIFLDQLNEPKTRLNLDTIQAAIKLFTIGLAKKNPDS